MTVTAHVINRAGDNLAEAYPDGVNRLLEEFGPEWAAFVEAERADDSTIVWSVRFHLEARGPDKYLEPIAEVRYRHNSPFYKWFVRDLRPRRMQYRGSVHHNDVKTLAKWCRDLVANELVKFVMES